MDQTTADYILSRVSEGESVSLICSELRINRNTVYLHFKNQGTPLHSKCRRGPANKFNKVTRQIIAEEYLNGVSSTIVATKHKCSHKTVLKCVKEFGYDARQKNENWDLNGIPAVNAVMSVYRSSNVAKKFGFSLWYEDFVDLIFKPCYYCGIKPVSKQYKCSYELIYNGIDRLDSYKGYHLSNVVPCCFRCNAAKNNISLTEFLAWLRRLVDNDIFGKLDIGDSKTT